MNVERTQRRIAKSIAYIEANLEHRILLADVADTAAMSVWYFSRLFPAVSGLTVADYIRRRKLSEAARCLCDTNEPIIDLAFRFSFGSQQAFTRAFKQCFGVSPGELRKTNQLPKNLQEMLIVTLPSSIPKTLAGEPEIKMIDALTLCGPAENFTMESRVSGIPALWQKFVGLQKPFVNRVGEATYGACISVGQHGEGFRYQAAVRVADPSNTDPSNTDPLNTAPSVPAECELTHIPAGRYAVFTHRGSVMTIKDTVEYIWTIWLPGNGQWQHRIGPDFEYYDDRFNPSLETGEMDIYIPID